MAKNKQQQFEEKMTLIKIAIRERLINYFKNLEQRNVVRVEAGIWFSSNNQSTQYIYQRRLQEVEQPQTLFIADAPLASMHKGDQYNLTFLSESQRSPQFREICKDIEDTLRHYLPTVEIGHEEYPGDELDDTKRLENEISLNLRLQERNENDMVFPDLDHMNPNDYVRWARGNVRVRSMNVSTADMRQWTVDTAAANGLYGLVGDEYPTTSDEV